MLIHKCVCKSDICAGLDVAIHAHDGPIESFRLHCIGSRDDAKIASGTFCRGYLGTHLRSRDQALVVQVATFFGQNLILHLHRGRSGGFEFVHGTHDIHDFAIACVRINY